MLRTVLLAVGALVIPVASAAQMHAGLGVGFSIPGGAPYQDLDPAPSFGAYLGRTVLGNAQAGVAFEYTPHRLAATAQRVAEIDFFAVLRYHFSTRDGTRFFGGVKAGFARQSASFSVTNLLGETLSAAASSVGFGIGPTVGAHFDRGAVLIEISVDALLYRFGERSADGMAGTGTAATGARAVPRVGLIVPFG